jgi:hypothetical protein
MARNIYDRFDEESASDDELVNVVLSYRKSITILLSNGFDRSSAPVASMGLRHNEILASANRRGLMSRIPHWAEMEG